jgi:hypothetical protein
MMELAPCVDRKPAQEVSYQACRNSVDTARPPLDVAGESARVEATAEQLEKLFDLMGYMECAQQTLIRSTGEGRRRLFIFEAV